MKALSCHYNVVFVKFVDSGVVSLFAERGTRLARLKPPKNYYSNIYDTQLKQQHVVENKEQKERHRHLSACSAF